MLESRLQPEGWMQLARTAPTVLLDQVDLRVHSFLSLQELFKVLGAEVGGQSSALLICEGE